MHKTTMAAKETNESGDTHALPLLPAEGQKFRRAFTCPCNSEQIGLDLDWARVSYRSHPCLGGHSIYHSEEPFSRLRIISATKNLEW